LESPQDNVYSVGSMDCDVNAAYTTRTCFADSRRCSMKLWNETKLVLVIWQM